MHKSAFLENIILFAFPFKIFKTDLGWDSLHSRQGRDNYDAGFNIRTGSFYAWEHNLMAWSDHGLCTYLCNAAGPNGFPIDSHEYFGPVFSKGLSKFPPCGVPRMWLDFGMKLREKITKLLREQIPSGARPLSQLNKCGPWPFTSCLQPQPPITSKVFI